ncbi:hypothetical protein FNAPI_1860 [Fusarium napiforme]|uniref:DUF6546 domain-containing protein n=1 Tax=Fusarium napiforme TaxID=42672 RepID=A0A8H5K4L5_9HYPO|nr:hypothetical protein FNAPI_1860 [Fusarium napiforme]
MGQEEIGLEVLPPPPGYSTSNQNMESVMPTSFTIHKRVNSEVNFNIRGNSGSTPLSIACTYNNTEDDFEARVNLLPRKEENASPLATIKYSRHSAELEFTNTSPSSHITMYYRLLGDRNATHSFNVNTPQRTNFEWRNIGDGIAWKLHMGSRPEVLACTGEFPTCAACQRRGAECNYADIANDREMHSNQLKRRVKELEDENRSFRNLFQSLRKRDGTTNQDLLQRIQAGDDFGTVIEHARDPGGQGKRKRSPSPSLMARQRPSDWTTIRGILPRTPVASPAAIYPIALPVHASPSPPPLPSPPINTPSSPKDAILGLLTLSQKGKPDLVLLNEARPKEHCDLRLDELSVSYWTRVPISNRSASTLISTFLETDNSAVGFIDKDLFLTDLVQHNPTFCSAFLVSSILYLACFAHTATDGRAATLAHSFFNDAERLYRAERLSDSLTTLAAINIFSLGCFSHGNENLGQDLLLSGRQMGDLSTSYEDVVARYTKFESKALSISSGTNTVFVDYGVLPFDVELFIVNDLIELYKHDEKRLTPLATVSETWQRIVEKHTFQNFKLSVQELPVFQSLVQRGRLQLVKSITLKVRTSPSWHEDCDWDVFQNILSSVISSTAAIEFIRIEKWWNVFGICDSRGGRTANMELLDLISQAADHLEHIAVSYAVSAEDFLDRCREGEFKKLRTLALTYRFNGIPSKKFSEIASQAVMRMPALEMLEVWELGLQGLQVHIFRLHPGISTAWKNVFAGREGYTLEMEEHRFARADIVTLSDMLPHLMLKDKILHSSTRERVSELTMVPPEIELYIVQALIETYKRSKKPPFRLSTFATVSKTWQSLIEKETYNHIKITSHELGSFKKYVRSYRKLLVKHILLEISYNFHRDELEDSQKVRFSKAVHALWRMLSRWKACSVAVELGIVSPIARSFRNAHDRINASQHYPLDRSRTRDPRFAEVVDFWAIFGPYFMGTNSASFDRTSFPLQGATSLPSVDAIAELVIRREYHPNISPMTLYEIISSAPCIESIHLERWCYGLRVQDGNWDRAFQRTGLLVPDSAKRLTYFEEFHTPYHQWGGEMVLPRPNNTLLDSISDAADRLEHIAVSFAFDAQTLFDRFTQTDFKALKTLALTSSFSNYSESLLVDAAEAVTKMHALQLLEIWNFEAGHADVFRYERLDRYQGRIIWQSTEDREISSVVEMSWKDLLRTDQSGFDAKCSSFPIKLKSLQALLPHLKLGEQILRNFI